MHMTWINAPRYNINLMGYEYVSHFPDQTSSIYFIYLFPPPKKYVFIECFGVIQNNNN